MRFGWIDDDGHLEHAAAYPTLRSVAGLSLYRGPDEPVLLYKAWTDVLGAFPGYPAQQDDDCVSFAHAHANDLLQCVEIALGENSEFRETDTEFLYGMSRQVAGILGGPGGSYGAAAVAAMTRQGMVSREMLGADGAYSGRRAALWGQQGPPAAVVALARPFLLGGAARVTTWDDLVAALSGGYPVTVSSTVGFETPRDAMGFCRARGYWPHCMFLAGVRSDRPGACVVQSWGPRLPQGPTSLGQPSYSFWADRAPLEAMLAAGDAWALSKTPAFVARPMPAHWNWGIAA